MQNRNLYITQNSFYFVHRFFLKFFEDPYADVIFVIEKKRGRIKKYAEIFNMFGFIGSLKIVILEIIFLLKLNNRRNKLNYVNINDADLNQYLEKIAGVKKYNYVISIGCPCKLDSTLQKRFNSKVLNIHGGIVPFQTGRFSPIKAILKKDKYLGVTIHKVTRNFDDGEILSQNFCELDISKSRIYIYIKVLSMSSKILQNFLKGKYQKIPDKIKKYFTETY